MSRRPGEAITGGAFCASACPLILAAGVERLVGPVPMVGVHQITEVLKEKEGLAHLTRIEKFYEHGFRRRRGAGLSGRHGRRRSGDGPAAEDAGGEHPLAEPPRAEASHLATQALDAAAPVLDERRQRPQRPCVRWRSAAADLLQARVAEPLALPIKGRRVMLEFAFSYRRGRGSVEAEMTAREADTLEAVDPPASGWRLTLTAGGGEPLQLQTAGAAPARAIIPRERFCALAHGRVTIASTPPERAARLRAD